MSRAMRVITVVEVGTVNMMVALMGIFVKRIASL